MKYKIDIEIILRGFKVSLGKSESQIHDRRVRVALSETR